MDKELLQQLKSLKKIQPSTKWKNSTREGILAQIMSDNSPQKLGLWAEFLYFIRFSGGFFHDFIMKPAGTLALVLILVLGGGIIKVKADSSLPGDLLYSLKRGSEKVYVALVFNKERKSDVILGIISERAKELNEVIYKDGSNREEKIGQALENFHKDFTPIKNSMAINSGNSDEVFKIAKRVEDKTNEFNFILSKAKNNINEKMEEDIEKVIEDVNKTNFEALQFMASGAESGNKDKEAVAKKIDSKIEEINDRAKNSECPEEALAKLNEAKENLITGDFVMALQKVKESDEILNEKTATSSNEQLTEQLEEATSTIEFLEENEKEATTTISEE